MATHKALQAIASETDTYPTGRDKISTAGLKTKAIRSRAIVIVYCVPVDFWWESNMATSSVVECA
jgi:hypothetical protein